MITFRTMRRRIAMPEMKATIADLVEDELPSEPGVGRGKGGHSLRSSLERSRLLSRSVQPGRSPVQRG
jgi:hypothetical protein